MTDKDIKIFPETTKDLFARRIKNEIINYPNEFGIITFTVKFNSGTASCLTINKEEKISLNSLCDEKNRIEKNEGGTE